MKTSKTDDVISFRDFITEMAKSEKIISFARRALPSFHCVFIALVPTPEKEVVPTRAKTRETRSFA